MTEGPGPGPLANVTDIAISSDVLHTGVRRLGINLGGQTFYDSGQMLRNLVFRNPGFEGETWQSILHCKTVSENTCTDANQYAVWPSGFLDNATYEVISGKDAGAAGTVDHSSAAADGHGVTLTLHGKAPGAGDFLRVRIGKPGNAQAGWWTDLHNGASLATEFHDLSPDTPGQQALRIDAVGPDQSATVSSYFDSLAGHSFVQLRGSYTLRFRARGLTPGASVTLDVSRLDTTAGRQTFFTRHQPLVPSWHNYTFTFDAQEPRSALGTLALAFAFNHGSALLDDVSLTEAAGPGNTTPFRNAVVETLRALRPGVLRYMDSGGNFGSSIDNMITPAYARKRTGASTQETVHEDIPLGLHEFLTLCQGVGAEPWYVMPPGTSPEEAANLIEYLAGSVATPYGHRRAVLGQSAPWTSVFPVIHLELGNEEWNARSFAGSSIDDPTAFGQRTAAVFSALRNAPGFRGPSFDLIMGSWSALPWWTGKQLASTRGVDTIAIAPYLFTDFNDASSTEAIFGPMLAQPQAIDGARGLIAQQSTAARGHGLAVYEVNLGTTSGTVTQPQIDETVPSLGAGLAVAEHMLLMLREAGVTLQCLFALPQFRNNFEGPGPRRTMPLWGTVLDMGGATDARRPQFLAVQLINSSILSSELRTTHSAPDPTWAQPKSTNDNIEFPAAHCLLSFAFAEASRHSLILFNLDRTRSLPVTFSGPARPSGQIREQRLNATALTDSNEHGENVVIATRTLHIEPGSPYSLPAHSMTVLSW